MPLLRPSLCRCVAGRACRDGQLTAAASRRSRRRPWPCRAPGTSAAVPVAHQMSHLAFDLRSCGAVVGAPGRIGLGGAGPCQLALVGADRDDAAGGRVGALRGQRAAAQAAPNAAVPPPPLAVRIGTVTCPGQTTVPPFRSISKPSLVNRPPSAVGGCTLVMIRAPAFSSRSSSLPAPYEASPYTLNCCAAPFSAPPSPA